MAKSLESAGNRWDYAPSNGSASGILEGGFHVKLCLAYVFPVKHHFATTVPSSVWALRWLTDNHRQELVVGQNARQHQSWQKDFARLVEWIQDEAT